jgi:predicted nucleic acid-binding protein
MSAKLVYLFDTNIITGKIFAHVKQLPNEQFFSGVVYTEVMAAADPKPFRAYLEVWKQAQRDARLIILTRDDWLQSGRILHRLAQERKADAGGKSPARTSAAKQELLADVLIATSAAREGVAVVTDDGDFKHIKRYLKSLRLISEAEFSKSL